MKKCNLCEKDKEVSVQPSGILLCHSCEEKVLARRAASRGDGTIVLDRMELWKLKTDGMLTPRGYVYLALRLDHPEQSTHIEDPVKVDIDIEEFCGRWRISQHNLLSALGALGKIGRAFVSNTKLSIQTLTRDQAMALLEKAAKNHSKEP